MVMPAALLDCTPTEDPAKEEVTEKPLTEATEKRARTRAVKDFMVAVNKLYKLANYGSKMLLPQQHANDDDGSTVGGCKKFF